MDVLVILLYLKFSRNHGQATNKPGSKLKSLQLHQLNTCTVLSWGEGLVTNSVARGHDVVLRDQHNST